jgi:CRISPR-associated protein Csx10
MKLSMHITMLSDWHVGTGTGRHGGIDRVIARDADELPYAPASTVRNVWRDAAETLARGLDDGAPGLWTDLVRDLFGSQPAGADKEAETAPEASLIRMTSDAVISTRLRARLLNSKGSTPLRDAMTFVKPGVAIDLASGTARDDYLRFDEAAVGGAVLQAEADVALADGFPPADAETVYWFLCGAACLIERLGGKRRRGLGKCEVLLTRDAANGVQGAKRWTLAELSKEAAKYLRLASVPKIARMPPMVAQVHKTPRSGVSAGAKRWQVPLAIELLAPLVMPDEVQGNIVTTLDFIPGSMLLPVVDDAARRSGMQDVESRIARGELRVLPATTDIGGRRGLPVPMAWGRPKDPLKNEPKDAIRSGILHERDRERQIKPLRKGYITPAADGGKVRHRESITTTLHTRNVIDDEQQTPTEDIGGLFSYQAIAARQKFRSLVLLDGTKAEAEALSEALTREAGLGRARQAGYGRVSIKAAAPEQRTESAHEALSGFLVVWLETDALLSAPDLSGATDLEALADAVARGLDSSKSWRDLFVIDADVVSGADAASDKEKTSVGFLRMRRRQSWHAKWGLPRPSLVAVQAGSVVKLKLKAGESVSDDQRSALERNGIGERRAEGFGVVRVDDVTVTREVTVTKEEAVCEAASSRAGLDEPLSAEEASLLDAITERAWKRRIVSHAEAVMSELENRKAYLGFFTDGSLTMSQLGALRSRLPPETAADAGDVVRWIRHQKEMAEERGRKPGWLKKIEDVVGEGRRDRIWEIIELSDGNMPEPSGRTGSLRRKLWAFAVTNTLLVAIRHHKRATEIPADDAQPRGGADSIPGVAR